jgi:hypothetical protein
VLANVRCTIDAVLAGTNSQTPPSSQTSLFLTDVAGSFTNTRFVAVDEAKREILAVALTAVSTYNQVNAVVDAPATAGTSEPNCYELSVLPTG